MRITTAAIVASIVLIKVTPGPAPFAELSLFSLLLLLVLLLVQAGCVLDLLQVEAP